MPAAVAATPAVGGQQRRPLAALVMMEQLPRPVGVLLAVLAVLAVSAHSLPSFPAALEQLQQQPQERLTKGAAYLTKFGWLDSASDPTQTETASLQSLSTKLAEFQRFAGLPVSGVLDDATVSKMQQPRCGVTDKPALIQPQRRRKRHTLQGSRWRIRDMTYRISNWPLNKDQEKTRKVIQNAFQEWEDVSTMTFTEIDKASKDKVNIDIRFEYGDHGDGDAFDGPSGVLAHAFFPIYGGAAHFDKSEDFNVDPGGQSGVDLFTVATHEFGHSLGLAHSDNDTALMAPFYREPGSDRTIVKEDDLNGIQELYGKPPKMLTPAPGGGEEEEGEEEVGEKEDSTLCTDNSSVDAMLTMTIRGKKQTFAFKGEDYWRLTDIGVMKNYPQKITDKWGGVPGDLDAVLVYTPLSSAKETLFFFKDKQVWRMTSVPKVDAGYPKLISEEFKGIPNDIDAAFTWKSNKKIYFFKGKQYWRFNYEAAKAGEQGVSANYPRDIRLLKGVPNNLDTVNTWRNGRTYVFKGNAYYKISDTPMQVSSGYPRSTGVYWFGCSRSQDSLLMTAASQQRGDISAEEAYQDNGAFSRQHV